MVSRFRNRYMCFSAVVTDDILIKPRLRSHRQWPTVPFQPGTVESEFQDAGGHKLSWHLVTFT